MRDNGRDEGEVSQWGYVEPYPDPFPFIVGRAGSILNPAARSPNAVPVESSRPRLDDPAVAEAVHWYTDLYLQHEVMPYFPAPSPDAADAAEAFELPPGYSLIESGQAAMWVGDLGSWSYRRGQMNVGVVPLPVATPDAKTTPVRASGLIVSAGSNKAAAAWRWLLFLSENVPDGGFYGGSTTLPARSSVAEANGF